MRDCDLIDSIGMVSSVERIGRVEAEQWTRYTVKCMDPTKTGPKRHSLPT